MKILKWQTVPKYDFFLYARAHHTAAKKLLRTLDLDAGLIPEFDLSPVLSTYRRTVELYLKVIVLGDGGNFLEPRPDKLSVNKTRSLAWLAQFVTQIVIKLRWQQDFQRPTSSDQPVRSEVLEFARRLDSLLGLLDRTADALAAEWDSRSAPAKGTTWKLPIQ